VDPKNSYSVTYQKGAILSGNTWNGGQTIGTVPGAPEAKARLETQRLNYRVLPTDNLEIKDVEITQGLKSGFLADDIHFQVESENRYIYLSFLGSDDQKRFYLLISPGRENRGMLLYVLDTQGKILAKGEFPAFDPKEKRSNIAYRVIPSGGVLEQYLETGDSPALVAKKLVFP